VILPDVSATNELQTLLLSGSTLTIVSGNSKLMKEDRDANFVEKNAAGVTVNRWTTTAFLSGSSVTNETGWTTYKVARGLGLLQIENQARI
jgi:hypothetical protein